ncbi:hypothetical protein M5G07_00860 [Serratia symbiotica]|nr:hypothetical protein [Serratia symbiotica]
MGSDRPPWCITSHVKISVEEMCALYSQNTANPHYERDGDGGQPANYALWMEG